MIADHLTDIEQFNAKLWKLPHNLCANSILASNGFLVGISKNKAHDNGDFFTPPSVVQTTVNVIEPSHGVLQYPCRYLNEHGRAGVVTSSQASSAGRNEDKVRRKFEESGA